jgi:hypothetical protein
MCPEDEIDVVAREDGSVVALEPLTPRGEQWLDDHLPDDVPRHGRVRGVAPASFPAIAEEMSGDALVVELDL